MVCTNDTPMTKAEEDQMFGNEWRPEAHDAACNAIRAIHYIDFEPATAQAIIAALSEKMRSCQYTRDYVAAIDALEDVFCMLDDKPDYMKAAQ